MQAAPYELLPADYPTSGRASEAAAAKERVRDYWEAAACGERYGHGEGRDFYSAHAKTRYRLEPYIRQFARFHDGAGKDVLEVGVGMGADLAEWASAGPHSLIGVDATSSAVAHARQRLSLSGLDGSLTIADAESLPFKGNSFDLVYSWGVLHHTSDTAGAVEEVFRVLRPGGVARIAVYHSFSVVGLMLWIRYALLRGRPWYRFSQVYADFLESPGTQGFSAGEARRMFRRFSQVEVRRQLSFGDLLLGDVGHRHDGWLLRLGKKIWPRWILRRVGNAAGLYLLVDAKK